MRKYTKHIVIFLSLTLALVGFSPFTVDVMAQGGTVLQNADEVRFMYWVINGPPGGTYPGGHGGPPGGLLGLIREINGPTALGGGLVSAGYTTCSSIPSTGSASMTDAQGTFTMTFGTPQQTIPAGWSGGGGNYAKRVIVDLDGTIFMETEFNCATTAGWMRFFEPEKAQAIARNIEVYYDTTDADNTKLELYMYYEPNGTDSEMPTLINEYFIAKFDTEPDNKYKIWLTRTANEGGALHGFRITIHGSTMLAAGGLANAHILFENGNYIDNTTEVASDTTDVEIDKPAPGNAGDIDCVDFNSGGAAQDGAAACAANGLNLSVGGAPIIDAGGDFSINWVSGSLKNQMSVLP